MRFVFHNGSGLLLVAAAMSWTACQDSVDDIGVAVDLNSNVIHGAIAFTNVNPDILAILHGPGQTPPGADDGFSYISIRANSTNVSPPLNNSSSFSVQIPPNTRTSVAYEVTNEAGLAGSGVVYNVDVDAYLDGNRDFYRFAQQTAAPLERSPAAPVTLDFGECAGILDIRWEDTAGNPVTVRGGSVVAYRERTPGGGLFDYQANTSLPSGSSRELMAVRGDALFRVDVTYEVGNDPFTDQFRHTHRENVTVACDEIVEIVIVIPDGNGGGLAAITGQIDMLGEDELRLGQYTLVSAQNGPFDNYRYDTVDATPSQGTFLLENLVPSSIVTPARGYTVYGNMYFRHAGLFQYFRTPFLDAGNGRVMVGAGETVDLGDTLVMDPGYVDGDIYLAGPSPGAGGSCVEALAMPQDSGGNSFAYLPSYLEASGINQLATGATKTAYAAFTQAAFGGAYDPAPGVQGFVGAYEMALGGLLQEATRWQTGRLRASFSSTATPQDPLSYQSSGVYIYDQRPSAAVEVVPGETTERPIRHCLGQLNLAYFSSGARFYNPRASGSGTLSGTDFEGNPASYGVSLSYAYGTPHSSAPGHEGMVVMCLPEGTYDLTPVVTTINPSGTTSETELPPVLDVEVSCREVKTITPELSMNVEATPACTTGATLALSGSVDSQDVPPQSIGSITTAVNGDAPVSVCTSCGVDPSFTAEVALAECGNRVVVRAEDAAGSFTEIERTVTRDGSAPEITGCADITVEADPALGGAYVEYAVAGADDCTADVGVVCDVASGSFFAAGQSTSVTCRSADACGNEATCSFAVRVDEPAQCDAPDPREQDYWRTQCNHRGLDGAPPDPAWTAESFQALLDGIEPDVQAVCGPSETSCQALNPDPYWDLCEQACQQYTAVLLNIASDLLPASCCTLEGTAGDLPARLASMIAAGQCTEVIDIAYELNRGCLFCEDGH